MQHSPVTPPRHVQHSITKFSATPALPVQRLRSLLSVLVWRSGARNRFSCQCMYVLTYLCRQPAEIVDSQLSGAPRAYFDHMMIRVFYTSILTQDGPPDCPPRFAFCAVASYPYIWGAPVLSTPAAQCSPSRGWQRLRLGCNACASGGPIQFLHSTVSPAAHFI